MFSHIQANLHLKLTIPLKHKVTFNGLCAKRLRDIEDVCPSSESQTFRKKIICTKKAYEIGGVAFTWNMGTSIFNWNGFYEFQKNTKCLSSCLICFQFHWKVHKFYIFETYFWASIAFERYRFCSGCSYDWTCWDLFVDFLIFLYHEL